MSEPARRRLTLLRALVPVALMVLIFLLSAMPGDEEAKPVWELVLRKLGHFAGYAALATAWFWALAPSLRPALRVALPAAAAIALLYAISDEYHQSFVPHRIATPIDVGIDAAGIAAAAIWIRFEGRRARARRP